MKRFVLTLTITFLLGVQSKASDVPRDILIYNEDSLSLLAGPLESYFNRVFTIEEVFQDEDYQGGCWGRSHIATWRIENDSLFLAAVKPCNTRVYHPDSIPEAEFYYFFDSPLRGDMIFADWIDSTLYAGSGRLMYGLPYPYESIHEFEHEFVIKKGVIQSVKHLDNSKIRRSEFSECRAIRDEFIYSRMKRRKVEQYFPEKPIVAIVNINKLTDSGKITSVTIEGELSSRLKAEISRIIRKMPHWEVIFRHGQMINKQTEFSLKIDTKLLEKYKKT